MAYAEHAYDHPAYLARMQMSLGKTTAGSGTTNCQAEFGKPIRIHNIVAYAVVAGTSTTNTLTVRADTTSIGLISPGSNSIGDVASSGQLDVTLASGTCFNLLGGTDATGVDAVTMEYHIPYNTQVPT